ncbi:eosinophil peroxidase-like [Mercenaria mercenaria]|uniref:eosinophil peroxidase-like n=1 Tax=Mercenaria mercenaria TaxID=6596 RepID=UPI00234F8FF6|nr:eosinophil peroxidase-like [Mercenaria mercenaria]XP_045167374.2 eosinophil peroxidase-like [Mercenaria mercenaria]XP_045167375.2 eosinophil peroxidase-like [Mercenaria mercenaria]
MEIKLQLLVYLGCIVVIHGHDDFNGKQLGVQIGKALKKGERDVKQMENNDKQKQKDGTDKTNKKTATDLLALFSAPEEDTRKLAKEASIQLAALKELLSTENLDTYRLKANKKYLRLWKKKFHEYCPGIYTGTACDPKAYYRTADGTCNNLQNPTWGAILCPQSREIPPMYSDGIDAPRDRDRLGLPLPSARVVSNELHKVEGKSPRNDKLTMMVMQWGQFIDHEFVATPILKGEEGANIECCGEGNENRTQCFPIRIPNDDPFFNKTCMGFVRSAPVPNHNCEPGFREQMNQVTSFIDGSGIYGSKVNSTNALRTMKNGLLKTFNDGSGTDSKLLPKNSNDKCTLEKPEDRCNLAGDVRVNVVPSLGWSHTCFMREHNRIARKLAKVNPHWDDEMLFQQTRRIMAAIIQIINYKEYLTAILNEETMKKYNLNLNTKSYSCKKCYKPKLNPTIFNAFAVAAFRFGHSQIADYQASMSKQYKFVDKKPIESTYHRPHMIEYDHGSGLDGIARWLAADFSPLADGLFEDGTRNKLFMDKQGNSLDLPALNIQRGRDHGIPGYNHWRIHCHLDKANMTKDGEFILPDHNDNETHKLEHTYRHVDDIDLFAGAMTETLLPDSSVGPTFACLIGKQFRNLKKGDRYWHETPDKIIRFTKDQLAELRKVTLARVMCDNFEIDKIQPNVFRVPGPGNERVDCTQLPAIDLDKWKSCTKLLPDGRPNFKRNCAKKRNV